jgi:hypothetical protein
VKPLDFSDLVPVAPPTAAPAPLDFSDLVPSASAVNSQPLVDSSRPAAPSVDFADLIPVAETETARPRRTRGLANERRFAREQEQRASAPEVSIDTPPPADEDKEFKPQFPWSERVLAPLGAGFASVPDNLSNINDWLNRTFYAPVDAVLGTEFSKQADARMLDRQENIQERMQVAREAGGDIYGQLAPMIAQESAMLPLQISGARLAQIGAATTKSGLTRAIAASSTLGGLRSASAEFASDTLEDVQAGMDPQEAAERNYPLSVAKGLATSATVAAFGPTGVEAIFRQSGPKVVVNKLADVLRGAGMEGLEEGVDEGNQVLLDLLHNREVTLDEAVQRVGMGMALGAIMGGGVNAYHAAYTTAAEAITRPQTEFKAQLDAFNAERKAATPPAFESAPPEIVAADTAETSTALDLAQFEPVNIPLDQLQLSKDVPNFKRDTDPETGTVRGEELQGKFERRGLAPIIVWERTDGRLEIITGRHRFDLAKRAGEKTIPSQIVREADGFTQQDALIIDAESNIRDGQGSVTDYATYFRNSTTTEADAREGGLLSRTKGRSGWALGRLAGDDLYSAAQAGAIPESKAVAIAEAAPGNPGLQRAGMDAAKGLSAAELPGFLRYLQSTTTPQAQQQGLFGDDESSLVEARRIAKAAAKRAQEISDQINAVRGAAKRPEAAAKLGVDVKDPDGLAKRIGELQTLRTRYQNFHTDREILAELGGRAPAPVPAPPTIDQTGEGNLFNESALPFNLTGQVDTSPQAQAEAQARADAAEAARLQAEQQQSFFTRAEPKANSDAEYLAAVERGDMETAQRMVDEAAKAGGYTQKAYHGTRRQFDAFDADLASSAPLSARGNKPGIYFTPDKSFAVEYAQDVDGATDERSRVISVYLRNAEKSERPLGGTEYRVDSPSDAKSADPVTYDSAGNVIPLSQRFNESRDEIHYTTGQSKAATTPTAVPASVPNWVLDRPETRSGRKLVERIQRLRAKGPGYKAIIDLVNDTIGVLVRQSKSQTSSRHPAHYRRGGHLIFTQDPGRADYAFHEAGHGLKELIEDRSPGTLDTIAASLIAITHRPGSMASANNVHEGVAEWLRLRLKDPASVATDPATPVIEKLIDAHLPTVATTLRDAARAVHAFNQLPVADRWALLTKEQRQAPSLKSAVDRVFNLVNKAGQMLFASGSPIYRLDNAMFRAIIRGRADVGLTMSKALEKARSVRKLTNALVNQYNMVLGIGVEVQNAFSSRRPSRGIRVLDAAGNFINLTKESWTEITSRIPHQLWEQFEQAGWARESLTRYVEDGMEYPGMREGVTPADLRAIVAKARKEIPDFDKHFAAVENFHNQILALKYQGGLKSIEDIRKMTRRETYWPLPRVVDAVSGGVRTGPEGFAVQSGDRRAYGSNAQIRSLHETTESRLREAYRAYHWNRMGTLLARNLRTIVNDKSLPRAARDLAGRTITPLKMKQEVVASLNRDEVLPWVMDALNQAKADGLGRPLNEDEILRPDDINLSWEFKDVFRPKAPKDIHVISLLEDGQRKFYQLGDQDLFAMFARPSESNGVVKFITWAISPAAKNFQRNITQSLPFAIANLAGDNVNQTILNRDGIGWIPGGATALGIWNKFAKKYPQVFQDGLLLSRVEPSSVELVNHIKHNSIFEFLTEGFYISTDKDPTTRVVSTLLNPSNLLFPAWKLGDLVNLVTGGRTLAPIGETATREGAAVWKKMRGGSDQEAMQAYWRVTGTFNEHAGMSDAADITSLAVFMNPMLQAVRNVRQVLFDPDPAVSTAAWAKLLLIMPSYFGMAAVARFLTMDDDEKERERERPIEDRMNYHDVAGFRIRFPYGPEGTMASFVYNATMDGLLDRPKADGRRTGIMLARRIASVDSPLQFFGPQLNALTEANMNWSNFRQRHIVSPWMSALPPSEQYSSHTPEIYRKLGEWINYSPDKIQYIVQQGISRQSQEVIQILDRIETGRPMAENADIPFVGRMFIRDPLAFSSASGESVQDIDARLRLLTARLNTSGWRSTLDMDASLLTPEMRAAKLQIASLDGLRASSRHLTRLAEMAKSARLGQDYTLERNIRMMMMQDAQAALAANPDALERIEAAIELLEQLPPATPEIKQMDHILR